MHMPWHGLDALQGTRAKPGNHLVIDMTLRRLSYSITSLNKVVKPRHGRGLNKQTTLACVFATIFSKIISVTTIILVDYFYGQVEVIFLMVGLLYKTKCNIPFPRRNARSREMFRLRVTSSVSTTEMLSMHDVSLGNVDGSLIHIKHFFCHGASGPIWAKLREYFSI